MKNNHTKEFPKAKLKVLLESSLIEAVESLRRYNIINDKEKQKLIDKITD